MRGRSAWRMWVWVAATMATLFAYTFVADNSIGQERAAEAFQAPRAEEEDRIISVYSRANKAVVNVSTKADIQDIFGGIHQEGSGSGVIIDAERAYVITNYHVIEGAQNITVALASGQTFEVRLVGQDPDNDIALLQIVDPPDDLVAIELGDSSHLAVGQRVLAIGNPFGLNRTLTTGIISSLGRTIRAESGRVIEDIIQTDAAINPGNSGGPLLDTAGRIVGLNTAILSRTGESSGIGFAIPVNHIKVALPQLIKYGKVLRPKMGVIIVDTDFGPMLLYVHPGSPADKAGLSGARQQIRQGLYVGYVLDFSRADFILAIGGKRVRTKSDVLDEIGKAKEDEKIRLRVRRGLERSRPREVTVTPILG